ncbi:hypothetical protein T492DRAFT_865697, partial [Pavlovales sp. CCMP2436]
MGWLACTGCVLALLVLTSTSTPCLSRARGVPRAQVSLAAKKAGKPAARGKGFGVPASGALALRQPELLAGYETLYAWLDAGGATRRVTIADFDGLRGVVATEPIAKGEAVISVPSALAIDLGVESAQARGPGEPCSAAEEGALRISPFLKAIPPIGSPDLSTPDFFTPEELAELQ